MTELAATSGYAPAGRRVAIVGAGGYSGAELTGLLLEHPDVRLVGLFGSGSSGAGADAAAARFADLHPRWRGRCDLAVRPMDLDAVAELAPDAVFLATPPEVSHDLAPELLDLGAVVLDLSAAFRLRDAGLYERVYGFRHRRGDLLEAAVYGLPELHRDALGHADLVALPGCYPTSVILALRPLVEAGVVDPAADVVVCSTSGVSGAGKTPTATSHFCEVSLQPYGVFEHRHGPEIDQGCGRHVVFTPHLGAYERGILSTMHVPLAAACDAPTLRAILDERYAAEPFVRVIDGWPCLAAVRHTNRCDIGLAVDATGRRLIVVSAIDNLLKGAAGQAVQCLNARLGLPETAGFFREASCPA